MKDHYTYGKTVKGIFLNRPNRFVAEVEINGKCELCHVKNTGRCRELLIEGTEVILEECGGKRKTKYDLIAVRKGEKLVNIDSQVPNKCAAAVITKLFENVAYVKPEYRYGSSRIDFYIEAGGRKILMEVKGVTLEDDGIVRFPDAPTERGVKHLRELTAAAAEGYEACVLFVVQLEGARLFEPNSLTHPEFADALAQAERNGVKIMVYGCRVTENTIGIDCDSPIPRRNLCN